MILILILVRAVAFFGSSTSHVHVHKKLAPYVCSDLEKSYDVRGSQLLS